VGIQKYLECRPFKKSKPGGKRYEGGWGRRGGGEGGGGGKGDMESYKKVSFYRGA